ncbi:hypothetical protein [Mycolicibacterium agri]|nr:hypothetical protein [Mycolicibacterium agri]
MVAGADLPTCASFALYYDPSVVPLFFAIDALLALVGSMIASW